MVKKKSNGIDLIGKHCTYRDGSLGHGQLEILSVIMKAIKEYLSKDSIVLDIGCGMGQLSFELSRYAKKVYAIDLSEYNIKKAKQINYADNIEYSIGDGKKLQFADGYFDLVVSSEVIEHVKDYPEFIVEIYRVGKKNAKYCITSPNLMIYLLYPYYWLYGFKNPIKYWKKITMKDNLKEYNDVYYDRWFYPCSLEKRLVRHKFKIRNTVTFIKFSNECYENYFKQHVGNEYCDLHLKISRK